MLHYSNVPGRAIRPGFSGLGMTGVTAGKTVLSTGTAGGSVATAGASLIGASAGAGSIVPVIGTAVGAVIGIALVLMSHKGQKPQRLAQAQKVLATLRSYPASMQGRTISWDRSGGGTTDLLFEALYLAKGWPYTWQAGTVTDHPSSMFTWSMWFMTATQIVVQAAASNPVGAQVTVTIPTGDKNSKQWQFINPGLIDPVSFATQILMPMAGFVIDSRHTADQSKLAASLQDPDAIHVFSMLYDYFAAQYAQSVAPQVLQAAPLAASYAAPVSASYVAPLPATQALYSPAPQSNTVVSASGQSIDVNALAAALAAQGQSGTALMSGTLAQLQNQGVAITPAVQAQVAAATTPAQAGFSWIGIALLAVVGIPLIMGLSKGSKSKGLL